MKYNPTIEYKTHFKQKCPITQLDIFYCKADKTLILKGFCPTIADLEALH